MHLLQSPLWAAFKSQFGWTNEQLVMPQNAVATQVLFRRLAPGLRVAYVPKGPALDWTDEPSVKESLQTLVKFARRWGVIFLKIEPDTTDQPTIGAYFKQLGFVSGRTVQPKATIVIDITPAEDDILAGMKSKTRYNIRLAARKGVTVRAGTLADLETFHRLSQITARRDGFGIHSLAYYQAALEQFPTENRALLLAEYNGEPLAGLITFAWDGAAYYLYGASSSTHRNKMPAYLLQWEAIKWAKSVGCHTYDLWGIPNAPLEILEAEFANRSDALWGVYRFKRGFGGKVVYSAGAFDYVYTPPLYTLFTKLLARRAG